MRRICAALLGTAFLAACGVDGAPVRPTLGATIGAGAGGVHTSIRTGARIGAVTVGVGVGR